MIAAVGHNNVIANKEGIPWQGMMPNDVKHFRAYTIGKPVIMGRKTYQELMSPLPDRKNYVLSRQHTDVKPGFVWLPNVEAVLALSFSHHEVVIIGGGQIYNLFLEYADKLVITRIDTEVAGEGMILFPDIDLDAWKEVDRQDYFADSKNAYNYSFSIYNRKSKQDASHNKHLANY